MELTASGHTHTHSLFLSHLGVRDEREETWVQNSSFLCPARLVSCSPSLSFRPVSIQRERGRTWALPGPPWVGGEEGLLAEGLLPRRIFAGVNRSSAFDPLPQGSIASFKRRDKLSLLNDSFAQAKTTVRRLFLHAEALSLPGLI